VDRTEKLSVSRTTTGVVVKVVIVEGGITASYSLKTWEHNLADSILSAKKGCNRYLEIAQGS